MNPNECIVTETAGRFSLMGPSGVVAILSRELAPVRQEADRVLHSMQNAFKWGETSRHRDEPDVEIVANKFVGEMPKGKRYWRITETTDQKAQYGLMPRGMLQRRPPNEVSEFISLMELSERSGRISMESKLEAGEVEPYDHSQGPEVYGRLVFRP